MLAVRPADTGRVSSTRRWVLGPPLLLALLLARTQSLSLCFQVAVLVRRADGGRTACCRSATRSSSGRRSCATWCRQMQAARPADRPRPGRAGRDAGRARCGAGVAALAMVLGCALLFLARWWQSLLARAGQFRRRVSQAAARARARRGDYAACSSAVAARRIRADRASAPGSPSRRWSSSGLAAAHRSKAGGRLNRGLAGGDLCAADVLCRLRLRCSCLRSGDSLTTGCARSAALAKPERALEGRTVGHARPSLRLLNG